MRLTKRFLSLILAAAVVLSLTGCRRRLAENKVYGMDDLPGKTVGVVAGSVAESHMRARGDVKLQRYENIGLLARALRDGAVDCAICEDGQVKAARKAASGVVALEEPCVDLSYCMAVSADNVELLRRLNETLSALRQDGTLNEIVSGGKDELLPPAEEAEGEESLTVAVLPNFPPYTEYDEDGLITGIEARLVQALCARLGLGVEFIAVSPELLLYMAESGKVSFAVGRITEDSGGEGLSYTAPYDRDIQRILVRKG